MSQQNVEKPSLTDNVDEMLSWICLKFSRDGDMNDVLKRYTGNLPQGQFCVRNGFEIQRL